VKETAVSKPASQYTQMTAAWDYRNTEASVTSQVYLLQSQVHCFIIVTSTVLHVPLQITSISTV